MDTRKLMHYQHQHSAKHYLGYHEGDHMNPVKLATFEKGTSDSAAYELVERFNKYPDLLSQRDELAEALTELELRATQARIASNIGQPRLKDADFLRGEMERIASHARTILSKLSQP